MVCTSQLNSESLALVRRKGVVKPAPDGWLTWLAIKGTWDEDDRHCRFCRLFSYFHRLLMSFFPHQFSLFNSLKFMSRDFNLLPFICCSLPSSFCTSVFVRYPPLSVLGRPAPVIHPLSSLALLRLHSPVISCLFSSCFTIHR